MTIWYYNYMYNNLTCFFPWKSPLYEASPSFLDDSRPMAWRAGMADKSTITREPHFSILKQVWTILSYRPWSLEEFLATCKPGEANPRVETYSSGWIAAFWRVKRDHFTSWFTHFSPPSISDVLGATLNFGNVDSDSFLIFGYAPLDKPLRPSLSYANFTLWTPGSKGQKQLLQ